MERASTTLVLIALIVGAMFAYHAPLRVFAYQFVGRVAPCRIPIPYAINTIDTDFGVSKSDVARAARDAIAVWEKAAGRKLFVESSDPILPVNLAYDVRQETTQTLKNLGQQISNSNARYDNVNTPYEAKKQEYQLAKSVFDSEAAAFQADATAYQNEVNSWNSRGGAPRNVIVRLNGEKADLQNRQIELSNKQAAVNALADEVNTLAQRLNSIAGDINATAKTYNKVGQQTPDEFEEGVFEARSGAESITVFQFDSQARLTRLLAHEFGHALGLDHDEGENSIMYKLNTSSNIEPTAEDAAALKALCRF